MPDDRELIRARVNIVDLVGMEVRLKKTGKNFTGLCPFHDDKHPSFVVSDITGTYRCWSCGAKGDIFTWIQERQRVSFREALESLAERAGVELTKGKQEDRNLRGSRLALMNAAQAFFVEQLAGNEPASSYCDHRGLAPNVREKFGIGFAPDFDEALPAQLKKAGFNLADAQELFLVEGDQANGYRSKFRGRLMFPIHDERGQLVAFGGRILGDGRPKYINSSDTALYKKSTVLYGLNIARDAITQSKRAVLVEGYLDAIACHRAGVTDVVASLGTALSEEHAKKLKRLCDNVVILYDQDEAGQKAAARASEMLLKEGLQVRIALMPAGQDPDTLLRDSGPEAVHRAVTTGLTPTDFQILGLKNRLEPSEPAFWTELASVLAATQSELEREKHILAIAPLYPGIRDPIAAAVALRRQIDDLRPAPTRGKSRRTARPRFGQLSMSAAERDVLLAAAQKNWIDRVWSTLARPELFLSEQSREIALAIKNSLGPYAPLETFDHWASRIEPEEVRFQYLDLVMSNETAPINATVLDHAILRLEQNFEARNVRETWQKAAETDDEELRAVNDRLRKLKGGSTNP